MLPWTAHAYDVAAFLSHAEGVYFAHVRAASLWPYGSVSLAALLLTQLPILFVPQWWTALPLRITLLKLPTWFADIGTAAIVRACAAVREDADAWALRYLVDPAVVFVTVFHGQNDALPNLCVVAGIALALAQRFELAGLVLGIGTGTKFYPAAFVPLLLATAYRNGSLLRAGRSSLTFAASAALALLPVMWGRSGAVFAAYRNNSFGWSGPHVSTASLWALLPLHQVPRALPELEQIVALVVPVLLAANELRHVPGRRDVARAAMLSAMAIVLLNPGAHPPFYLWMAGPLVLYAAVAGDWLVSIGGLALSTIGVLMQFCQEAGDEYLQLNFGMGAHTSAFGCVAPPGWIAAAALAAALFVVVAAYRNGAHASTSPSRLGATARFCALALFALFGATIASAVVPAAAARFDASGYRAEEIAANTFALAPRRERRRGSCSLVYDGRDVLVYAGNDYAARFAAAALGYTLYAPETMRVRGRDVFVDALPSRYENADLVTIDQRPVRVTREFEVSSQLRPFREIETFEERPCTLIDGTPVLVYRYDFAAAQAAAAAVPLLRRLNIFARGTRF